MMPDVTGMDVHARVKDADGDVTNRFVFMTGGAFTPHALARASVSRRDD